MNLLIPRSPGRRFTSVAACFWAYGMFLCMSLPCAPAGPENPQVVNGDVSIQQSGYNTTITASDKAIINYSSFDIARPETVRFIQPDSNASVLNRILSATPTTIDGTLLANGCVFFVNPAGVYFGAGAQVNVNQLVASALNISDSDFLNGRYDFASGDGAVVNSGNISAERVALIGREVTNSGSISCPEGYVVMAAGDRVFLAEPGFDVIVEVCGPGGSEPSGATDSTSAVRNEATDDADDGIRALAGAGDLYSYAISNVGTLSVSTETGSAGKVVLAGGGEVTNTGTIEATGGAGGQVTMEGARVGQFGTIHADGIESDGGDVNLRASQVVALSSDSLTTANAGANGDGGTVIVYSPDTALFWPDALIEAKGGSESGDGGFVEVSGKEHVEVYGVVDTGAPSGQGGTFYLDPFSIAIDDAGNQDGSWIGFTWTPTADTSVVTPASILSTLNANTVIVDATAGVGGTGQITVNSSIDLTGETGTLRLLAETDIDQNATITNIGNGMDLELLAKNGVDIGADITATGTGNVTINADNDSSGTGSITRTAGTITMAGGDLRLVAGSGIGTSSDPIETAGLTDVAAATTTGGIFINNSTSGIANVTTIGTTVGLDAGAGDISLLNTGRDVTVSSAINAGGGSFSSSGANFASDSSGAITTAGGSVTLTHTGDVTVGATIDAGTGSVSITSGGAINDAADDTLVDIVANDLTLTAANEIGGTLALPLALDTTVASLDASSTSAGDIIINETDGITLSKIETNNGNISITSSSGDISLSDHTTGPPADRINITAGNGNVTLNANSGSIIVADSSNDVEIQAAGSVQLTGAAIGATNVLNLAGATALEIVDTGAGNIDIVCSNGDSVDIDDGYVLNNIDLTRADSPSFSYTAGTGDITVNTVNLGNKAVTIEASTGSINDAGDDLDVDIEGSTVTLTAQDEIGGGIATKLLDTRGALEVASSALDVSVTNAANIVLTESDGTELTDVDTLSGSIDIVSTAGDLTIGDIDATGTVTLEATSGSINDAGNDLDVDIEGTTVALTAQDEIGGTRTLETTAANLEAHSTVAGDIVITESDGITLADIDTFAGDIMITADGLMNAVSVIATDGSVDLSAGGLLTATDVQANESAVVGVYDVTLATSTGGMNLPSVSADHGITAVADTGNIALASLTAGNSISLEATAGAITQSVGIISVNSGALTMVQSDPLDTKDFTFANQGSTDLTLQSSNGSVTSDNAQVLNAADKWRSITATAKDNIELEGSGNINIASAGLSSTLGGVKVVSTNGTISTPGSGGALDAPITGYSDAHAGTGVDLPFSPGFQAAIVISSKEALVLGPQATLQAYGIYYADVDDRPGVGFLTFGDGAGDLLDVAIYLGSPSTLELFNVDVRSKVDFIGDYGGMVIDGGDAVTFKNPGSLFLTSEAFDMTNRLEVVSRSSITKEELVFGRPPDQPKLPYAQNPEDIRTDWPLFAGAYVLRGELGVVGNARQLDWTGSVPLALPKPLEIEETGNVEGPDVEGLIALLSDLGIGVQPYMAEAYAGSLSTDLRLLKAAERLQGLIAMLEDADGKRTAALRVVVGKSFPTLDSISEEQVDSFRRELAGHTGDGTDHDLAGQTLSALRTYVDILSTDVGWPMDRSVGFVMARYVPRLTEGDDIRTAVLQMQLEQAPGT